MLSNLSFSFISFINFFFIPLISLRIYNKRHSLKWELSFELFYNYSLSCIFNLISTRIIATWIESTTATICHGESTKYTMIAVLTAVILPFIVEVIEKIIKVDVIIEPRKFNHIKDVKDEEKEDK